MHRTTQLQFQRLPLEAQRATLWRLAWAGLPVEQIADRTGLTTDEVRQTMHEELAPAQTNWMERAARVALNA